MLHDWMSTELGLEREYITALAKSASYRYKKYFVSKRSGGVREIFHPSKELKATQRWLLRRVIRGLPVHEAAVAYRKGVSILANARRHQGSRYLLRMDFSDFFPSLTAADIMRHLQSFRSSLPSDWSREDDILFTQFVCREGKLTIGSVTAPALSNTLCVELDTRITDTCAKQNVTYTRYADDLFFSSNVQGVLSMMEKQVREDIVKRLPYPSGLSLNLGKTRHSSKRNKRLLTGLVLTSDGGISLGHQMKRRIKGLVHKIEKLGPADRMRLAGLLAHCKSVEPDFINRLILKFGWEKVRAAQKGS